MNSLIFNPHITTIEEWVNVYLSEEEITHFQTTIDRTCSYLKGITSNTRIQKIAGFTFSSSSSLGSFKFPPLSGRNLFEKRRVDILKDGDIEGVINEIKYFRQSFKSSYQGIETTRVSRRRISSKVVNASEQTIKQQMTVISQNLRGRIAICEGHLNELKKVALDVYEQFIYEENKLLLRFIRFKLGRLLTKFSSVSAFLKKVDKSKTREETESKIRIVFDNVYIQCEYLRILIKKNMVALEDHSYNDHSGDYEELTAIRDNEFGKLKVLEKKIEELKQRIRELYFYNYSKKKSKLILRDSHRLQHIINTEVAVNVEEFKNLTVEVAWLNGFVCAVLILALSAIIVFRDANKRQLEAMDDYKIKFQIWRGASYPIIFNWVCAVVFYLLNRWNINYRLVMLEGDKCLGKCQDFFRSSSILTTIYLILFLVYTLYRLEYIEGYDQIDNFGYFMWIIDIAYVINPFKVLNYHSRFYFLSLIKKVGISPFNPMNMRILFVTFIIGSFAQPLNDLAFTISSLKVEKLSSCQWIAKVITFVVLLVFFSIRIVQSFRLHHQYGQGKCLSKARIRLIAVIFSIATIIASFLYAMYLTQQMLIFWIVAGSFATLARSHSEIRADWSLISMEEGNCLLRKNKAFRNIVYYICMVLQPILDVAWTLTISNNTEAFFRINVLYFFLLVSCIELIRRGLWMILRIEDEHSSNVGNLCAMADDSEIMAQIQKAIADESQGVSQPAVPQNKYINTDVYNSSEGELPLNGNWKVAARSEMLREQQFEIKLQQLKERIDQKQKYLPKIKQFLIELEKYFNTVRRTYERLSQEEELL